MRKKSSAKLSKPTDYRGPSDTSDQLRVQTGNLSSGRDFSQTIKGIDESLIYGNRLPLPGDPLVVVPHDYEGSRLTFEDTSQTPEVRVMVLCGDWAA